MYSMIECSDTLGNIKKFRKNINKNIRTFVAIL